MKGTDWMRHCTECNLNVYNFSEMTWKEVERLVASRQGRLCARFYRRADGTVLTQDCPKGLRAVVRRVSRWAGAMLSAITVISSAEAQPRSWAEHIEEAQAESGSAVGSPARGDGSVTVEVRDRQGMLMAYAKVTVLGNRGEPLGEGFTDGRGRARLQSLPAGTFRLVVIYAGFESDTRTFVLGERQAIELSVTMRPEALQGAVVESFAAPVSLAVPLIEKFHFESEPEKRSSLPPSSKPYAWLVLKVKDQRGLILSGVTVVLRDSISDQEWTGVSDSQGNFVVPSLPRGRYTLTVRASGFNAHFTDVDAKRSGEINIEVALSPEHISELVSIEEMRRDSVAQENGTEAAFR
jgi:hypothetical protein